MKKLLYVLMFGMMFGQTKLETRVYELENIIANDIINITDITGHQLDYYILNIINISPLSSSWLWHYLRLPNNNDIYS